MRRICCANSVCETVTQNVPWKGKRNNAFKDSMQITPDVPVAQRLSILYAVHTRTTKSNSIQSFSFMHDHLTVNRDNCITCRWTWNIHRDSCAWRLWPDFELSFPRRNIRSREPDESHSGSQLPAVRQIVPFTLNPTPTRLNCRVESRLRCERTRRQSWPSAQFPVLLSHWGWWQVRT